MQQDNIVFPKIALMPIVMNGYKEILEPKPYSELKITSEYILR